MAYAFSEVAAIYPITLFAGRVADEWAVQGRRICSSAAAWSNCSLKVVSGAVHGRWQLVL